MPSVIFPKLRCRQRRLPYAVLPESACARSNAHEGSISITLAVDLSPLSKGPDAGSKPWLLAHALDGGGDRQASKGMEAGAGGDKSGRFRGAAGGMEDGEVALPEDRFHLKLPKGQGCLNCLNCLKCVWYVANCCVEPWTRLSLGITNPNPKPYCGRGASIGINSVRLD